MSSPVLSILLPAMSDRSWTGLAADIQAQCTRSGGAELCVSCDGGRLTSGQKRQRLVESARGDYIAFIDDDDTIDRRYVRALVAFCRRGVDVVTFDMAMRHNGVAHGVQTFGVANADHRARGSNIEMTANHLCAWRREIATRVAWDPRLGYGDDQLWYKPLVRSGTFSEAHIPKVLYHYRYEAAATANQTSVRMKLSRRWYGGGVECYRRGGELLIATAGNDRAARCPIVEVRDARNVRAVVPRDELERYATVELV